MNVFMIIVFGLATVRTIVPLSREKDFTFSRVIVSIITIAAYVILLNHFIK